MITRLFPENVGGPIDWLGESTRRSLSFTTPEGPLEGEMATFPDGTVRMRLGPVGDGVELVMTPAQALDLAKAGLHCSYVAEQRGRELAGDFTVRVERVDSSVFVSWRGERHLMRLGKTRTSKMTCTACGEKHEAGHPFWVPRNHQYTWGWAKVCEPCVTRLSLVPAGVRRVP
jgi:hypothetical protein